jgi:hypothetical protein
MVPMAADELRLDEKKVTVLPDLIRTIQDLRLAAAMVVGTPAHPRVVNAISRLVAEVYRLRTGPWIDEAAQEIASDPRCSDPRVIAETLRRLAAPTSER